MSESAWIQLPGQRRTEKRSFSVARVLDVWSTHGLEGVRLMPVYDLAVALSVLFSVLVFCLLWVATVPNIMASSLAENHETGAQLSTAPPSLSTTPQTAVLPKSITSTKSSWMDEESNKHNFVDKPQTEIVRAVTADGLNRRESQLTIDARKSQGRSRPYRATMHGTERLLQRRGAVRVPAAVNQANSA
eukprot:CAMPEP_0114251032 /NCGR_PEP_ID=MMETSP0058-20121206/15042_1 /TAXON_ID=36894 /ORGANISM="Pyramimonas parkeae, CCMP726" /LENGTH=188 /DNA_ID=CAMNT_0001364783 /DNA_START=384 /DNA_END=950 /DNA_ORIENTATION=+